MRKHVQVGVQGERGARMSKLLGHYFRRDSNRQRKGGRCVAKIVESNVRQTSFSQERFEMLLDQVFLVDRFATRGGKDQISEHGVARRPSLIRPALQLPEQIEHPHLQFNDSTTAGPLRVRKSPSPFILVESSNDADGSTIPVDVPPAEGEVFAGAHSGSEGHSKKARLWGMRCSPEKRSSLLCRQHRHFSALLTRKGNSLRWIAEEQLPTYSLPDCSTQNGMRASNRPCREFPVDHALICGPDFKRRECGQHSCANCRTDVSAQHGRVVAVRFPSDFWFDGRFQPVIQEFVYGDLKPFDAAGQVAFMQPSCQVRLCIP